MEAARISQHARKEFEHIVLCATYRFLSYLCCSLPLGLAHPVKTKILRRQSRLVRNLLFHPAFSSHSIGCTTEPPLIKSQTDVKEDVKELIRVVQFVEPTWHRLKIVYEDGSRYGVEHMVGRGIRNSGFSELPLPPPRIELLKKLLMENHIRWTLDDEVPLSDTILFYMEESPRATLLDRRNIKGELREILEELGVRFK